MPTELKRGSGTVNNYGNPYSFPSQFTNFQTCPPSYCSVCTRKCDSPTTLLVESLTSSEEEEASFELVQLRCDFSAVLFSLNTLNSELPSYFSSVGEYICYPNGAFKLQNIFLFASPIDGTPLVSLYNYYFTPKEIVESSSYGGFNNYNNANFQDCFTYYVEEEPVVTCNASDYYRSECPPSGTINAFDVEYAVAYLAFPPNIGYRPKENSQGYSSGYRQNGGEQYYPSSHTQEGGEQYYPSGYRQNSGEQY